MTRTAIGASELREWERERPRKVGARVAVRWEREIASGKVSVRRVAAWKEAGGEFVYRLGEYDENSQCAVIRSVRNIRW